MMLHINRKVGFALALMTVAILVLLAAMNTYAAIPGEKATFIFSPYYFDIGAGGEKELEEVSRKHGYVVVKRIQRRNPRLLPNVKLESLKSAIAGRYGIVFVSSHGSSDGFAAEVYEATGLGKATRDIQFWFYTGADSQDTQVWLAIRRPLADGVDNDNNGTTDDASDRNYNPAFDDDEDGIMDEGGLDTPGDANGDGAPGWEWLDDDGDGKFTLQEIGLGSTSSKGGKGTGYAITVRNGFIRKYAPKMPAASFVFLGSCNSSSQANAFAGAGVSNAFGYEGCTNSRQNIIDVKTIFWSMGGMRAINNTQTNHTVNKAYTEIKSNLQHHQSLGDPDAGKHTMY